MTRRPPTRFSFALALAVVVVAFPLSPGEEVPRDGLVLWLDAADVDADGTKDVAPLPGSGLAEWRDRSDVGNDLTQDEVERRPAVERDERGRAVLRFGGDDTLERSVLAGFATGDQALHAFIVLDASMHPAQPNPRILDLRSGRADTDARSSVERHGLWVGHQGDGRNRLGIAYGDEARSATVAWDDRPRLLEVVYEGRQRWSMSVDGRREGTGAFAERTFLGFAGPVSIAVGQHHGQRSANTFLRGDIAELLLYRRALPVSERLRVGRYLTLKHALRGGYTPVPALLLRPGDRQHWAFRRLRSVAAPDVDLTDRVRNEIDVFVLRRLQDRGLALSPDADRRTIARRVHLDVTGLLPEPEDVEAFVRDDAPDAYGRLVRRLLGSPHFGERWGRHWLDVAGHSDVGGADNDAIQGDGTVRKIVKGKWQYRDYVIDSFNRDLPLDDFLVQQIAGDELVDWRSEPELRPGTRRLLIATGFVRSAVDDTDENELNTPDQRHGTLQRTVEVLATGVLGLTISCAKCHHHKYEPLSQHDYYRLTSFFQPALSPTSWLQPAKRRLPAMADGRRAGLSSELDLARAGRASSPFAVELEASIERLRRDLATTDEIDALYDVAPAPPTHLLHRGEHDRPLQEVAPGFPAVLRDSSEVVSPRDDMLTAAGETSGRRLALARWLTSWDRRGGALVARVWVNRLWRHLMGRGIVTTPGNFGKTGAPPTHPQLLEWLARAFVEKGRRTKPIIEMILLSSAYRQSSELTENHVRAREVDPGGDLLWHARLRRLDAEIVRDALLCVSGALDRKLGGPSLPLAMRPDGRFVVNTKGLPSPQARFRRSVYVLARRNYHLSMLGVFDQPAMGTSCVERSTSSVVLQSLAMLNDELVIEQAERTAKRVKASVGAVGERFVEGAFRRVLCRPPSADESTSCLQFLEEQTAGFREAGQEETAARDGALAQLCHMLLNTSEFLYAH